MAGAAGLPPATPCTDPAVQIAGANPSEFSDLCEGAAAALAFLQARGLVLDQAFTIEVAHRMPDVVAPTAAGCFLQERRRAYVLPYAQFKKQRQWFGVRVDRALYRALATHESAHAVAGCNFKNPKPSIQATEYVAYVTMFATMPPALRTRALRSMPGTGFADVNRVSAMVYLFDPLRFGAEAYRHFIQLPDGDAFLKQIMSGQVLAD